jgi:hypothetical protein
MLAERGAQTLGVDRQPAFAAHSDNKKSDRERSELGNVQCLDGVTSGSFDIAVSYITPVDVPDLARYLAHAAPRSCAIPYGSRLRITLAAAIAVALLLTGASPTRSRTTCLPLCTSSTPAAPRP